MKTNLLVLLLLTLPAAAVAQSPLRAITLGTEFGYRLAPGGARLYGFVPGLLLSPNGRSWHQIEWLGLRVDEQARVQGTTNGAIIVGSRDTELHLAWRYQWLWTPGEPEACLQPLLGLGAAPYLRGYRSRPLVSSEFASRSSEFGSELQLILGARYHRGEHWYADVSVNTTLVGLSWLRVRVNDPSVPVPDQAATFSQAFGLERLGLQVRIGRWLGN